MQRIVVGFVFILISGQSLFADDTVLATVNGTEITTGDLEFLFLSRRVPEDKRDQVRERFLEILVERQLMREFLESRKAKPNAAELDDQVKRIIKLISSRGDDPDRVLSRLGMTRETLRAELALPSTWKSYLRLVISNDRLRKYFEKHRSTFDGTKVRVRQIFLRLPADADETTINIATKKLQDLKQQIEAKTITFEEAAMKFSEAPSKTNGGDAGWITYRGTLTKSVSDAAFALETGTVSAPIRSPFGIHLVTVTDRRPGDLSLEDVRSFVFNQLAQELWTETVKAQRSKAKIEIRSEEK